ncbi:MFS transporter [Nocardioides malaquae]|uniref:MFS transporter n=1 Tax=Nocardioides malaquae TaxID=2773426 RepID=UPI0029D4132A|nr:MFS transporter [Nocardioides malaquae]
MTDPLIDNVIDTVGDQEVGRELPKDLPRALRPFKVPAYRRLAVSLSFGAFASGVWIIALVWEVFRLGGSAGDLSFVSAAAAVGVILPALFAGVVADRVTQKYVLIGVAAVETTGFGLAGLLAWGDLTSIWVLAAIAFGTGTAMAFYYPAYSAMLPSIVPEQDLMAVNGFEGMVRPTISQAIGPAVAGLVVGAAAPAAAFGIASASMFCALLALVSVPRTPLRRTLDPAHAAHPVRSALTDMREGFAYMLRTPWLLATLSFACLMLLVMMGPLEVLIPFMIKSELGGDASDHSLVLAAFGIGGALGSFVMSSIRMPRRYLTLLILGWGVSGLPFLVIAHADSVWTMVAAGGVMGALFSAPMVIWGTLLQRRVPPELLGRVSSLDFFVSIALMPVSMALAAPVADAIGLELTFYIAALAPVVFSVAAVVWGRTTSDEVAHPLT